jgi:hypothetical protein
MIISLDFDDTFTADRETWTKVASVLVNAGHEVICISGRIDEESNQTELRQSLPESVERIYLCGPVSKKHYAETHSILVDVWIDDSPSRIVQAKDRVVRPCCARRSR